ncbi:unnamed protein product [Sphenostylis stenocarpa]|uniref:BAG domain-containing protein n=1 Tax=Sphenostylis stenocarpa TaxID=92480 RepID=A0AA86V9B6_9FABA|nr:unnamed protein product [Sphenostylis stenocarpa]
MMPMKNSPLHRTRLGMAEPGYYRAPSKVVSIPVHFVGSEHTRTDSAIKIQRILRGFLVRNVMKKIAAMGVELERIESEIQVEVLRRDQRERVRVTETIMNLLLRLDSVRVLHYSGLRECRKSVIRKAIALQEMLDDMAVPNSEGVKVEATGNEEEEKKEKEGECVVGEDNCLVKEEQGNGMENLRNEGVGKESGGMEEESIGLETSLVEGKESEITCEEQEEGEEIEALRIKEVEEKEDGEVGQGLVGENCLLKEEEGNCEREEGNEKRELLLEKILEDNKKMMEMMAQLFQRNEIQTTLHTSLSQRVEQLERAFVCEKLRRKKKCKSDRKHKQNHPRNDFI